MPCLQRCVPPRERTIGSGRQMRSTRRSTSKRLAGPTGPAASVTIIVRSESLPRQSLSGSGSGRTPTTISDSERRLLRLATLPDDAPYVEWGRWFLSGGATRPNCPGVSLTPKRRNWRTKGRGAVSRFAPTLNCAPCLDARRRRWWFISSAITTTRDTTFGVVERYLIS